MTLFGSQRMLDNQITDIVHIYNTPVIIYRESEVYNRILSLQNCLPPPSQLVFSVKANPNPTILNIFLKSGLLFEVASAGELSHILRVGIPADKILFGGPIKQNDGILIALKAGILAFNVESLTDLLRIQNLAKKLNQPAKVMLRVNPSNLTNMAVLRMGGNSSQFGIDEEQLMEIVQKCTGLVNFTGLFMYAGSQYFDAQQIVANTQYLCRMAKKLRIDGAPPIQMIDFGGGFGVPETENQKPINLDLLYNGLKKIFDEELPELVRDGLEQIFFESGRFLTATSAIFVTRVMDVKWSQGQKYVIVDGGINNLGIKQFLYRTYEPQISILGKPCSGDCEIAIVVGPTCTPIDIVHRDASLSDVKVGDLLCIENCGAYQLSYSPVNFCGHPTPAEVMINGDSTVTLMRKRGRLEDACGTGFLTPN